MLGKLAPPILTRLNYVAQFTLPPPPPVVNPPPGGYIARVIGLTLAAQAWLPGPPQPQTNAVFGQGQPVIAPIVPGRIFLLSPDVRTIIDLSDIRAAVLPSDVRTEILPTDIRTILLPPDVRTIILPRDEDEMVAPTLQWSPSAGADTDIYFLSLAKWLPVGDTVNTPSVVVTPISGDLNPMTVGAVSIDTGTRQVTIPPGVPFTDPGPRIEAVLSGGTTGKTYTTIVTWQDSQGRTISRPVLLFVQW